MVGTPTSTEGQLISPIVAGSAIGVAGDVGMSFLNQKFANDAADKSKNLQRYFMLRQYKMAMRGLSKAGLNPILAAQRGISGVSAPQVTAAKGAGNVGSTVAQGVNSALMAKRLNAELKNIEADTIKKEEEGTTTAVMGARGRLEQRIMQEKLEQEKAATASAKSAEELYKTKAGKALRWLDILGRSLNPFASATDSLSRSTKR